MKTQALSSSKKGFTLIELIVVIAILAVLAGISYPTLMSMKERPLITAANKTATDLVQGINNFKSDHNGLLPIKGRRLKEDRHDQYNLITENGEDASLVEILTNREDKNSDDIVNSSQEVYMRSDVQESPRDGLFISDDDKVNLYDPWGKPYYLVLTYNDAEGCIDPFTRKSTGKPVLVFSLGGDMEGAPADFESSSPARRSRASRNGKARKTTSRSSRDELKEQLLDNIYSWKKLKN
ncbi:MAG: prepilin-type N-terminal cleavage/methylation domain-containing protein [Akkermansia sp.]